MPVHRNHTGITHAEVKTRPMAGAFDDTWSGVKEKLERKRKENGSQNCKIGAKIYNLIKKKSSNPRSSWTLNRLITKETASKYRIAKLL